MKNLILKIISTHAGLGITIARVVMGVIFFKAGSGKLFGWFGGYGIEAATDFFKDLGIPYPDLNAYLVGTTELLGGAVLILGLFTRLAVIPLCITMVVAILTADKEDPYYPLALLVNCIVLFEIGSGSLSIDRLFSKSKNTNV